MDVKSGLLIVSASALVFVTTGCAQSPTAPSGAGEAAESALFAVGDSSGLAARPGKAFCDYPDVQVTATANGSVMDGSAAVFGGAFSGVHRDGTMAGTVAISVTVQNVLRNRALELVHEHTLTLPDGAFTYAGRSLLRPVSGQPASYQLRERLPVTGGTKIFLDAQGELRLDGVYDRTSGVMQYRLTGEICRTGLVPIE